MLSFNWAFITEHIPHLPLLKSNNSIWEMYIFSEIILFFIHLTLEIALAIPAAAQGLIFANNAWSLGLGNSSYYITYCVICMVLLLCYVRTESIQLRIYIKRKRNPRVHIHSSASETEQDAYVRRNTDTKLLDPPPPPPQHKIFTRC